MRAIGSLTLLLNFSQISYAAINDTSSQLRLEKVHIAEAKKINFHINDGLIIGGDRAIQVLIKDIRHSSNSSFERIVLDLEGNRNGEPAGIPRPPYYQVEVSSNQKRIGISIWGQPKLNFDPKRIVAQFKQSKLLQTINLFPKLEDDVWTFELPLKSDVSVEVFELTNPVRIIMDISRKKG